MRKYCLAKHQTIKKREPMMQGAIGMMFGMNIHVSPHIPRFTIKQFRFPRSKGKRIQKKWAKDPRNRRQFPVKNVYVLNGNTIVMHPEDYAKIKRLAMDNVVPNCDALLGKY